MAGRLSFSIAINLLTDNFRKGASSIKSAFKSMQMQVLTFAAAMGAGGLGLSNFVSRLIDTARETNRVTTALKNVSGSATQFADNQRFLLDMANKYGIEINSLTSAYAQFTAAANVSGMGMESQRKVFESVSRATTAFGMSAEDSKGVFLALSQMMSKGKISSEELRLQMGERLPIALQAMAKAAGTSVAGLDKLLKQGKLMSADVLPRFAEALNEMIPNIDTDNLETSINHLKNALTEFTKNTGIGDYYKKLVDKITEFVKHGADNIRSILYQLSAVITGVILGKLFKWIATELAKAQRAAMLAAARAARAAGQTFDEIAWRAQSGAATVRTAFVRAGVAIRTAFMAMLPTAVFAAIASLVAYLINVREEAKRIKNMFSDYKKEIESVGNTQEVVMLEKQLAIMNDKKQKLEDINNAQAALQKALGVEAKSQEELNRLVSKRIELLRLQAEIDARGRIKAENEVKKAELVRKRESLRPDLTSYSFLGGLDKINSIYKYSQNEEEIKELDRIIKDNDEVLKGLTIKANGLATNTTTLPTTPPDDDTKKTDLQKAEESYAKKLRELEARREVEGMTVSAYNKALDELNKSALIEAKASNDKQILESEYLKNLQKAVDNPNYTNSQKSLDEFLSVKNDYEKEAEKFKNQLDNGVISQKDYNEKLASLAESTLLSAGALSGIGEAGEEFIKALQGIVANNAKKVEKPELKSRDTTFDYKKTDLDITREKLDIAKENAEKIREAYNKGATELEAELNNALSNVGSLEDALKIAEVQQDIKELNKEFNMGLYSGVKEIASSADRVVSSFSNLKDVFNDVDSSGWERILAIWNAITQTVDSFLSILNMIETLTTLTQQLTKAKEAEAAIDTAVTMTKLTNDAEEMASSITVDEVIAAVDTQTTNQKVGNDLKEAASSTAAAAVVSANNKQEVAGNTAAAASGAAKSVAGIPLVGWIMAGAAVASIIALMATLPKFAKGGVIGGTSGTGDKLLARVNSGEMILTQSQQATLFQLANGKGLNTNSSSGKEVVFRIEGDTLVGVLNNYNRRRRRI